MSETLLKSTERSVPVYGAKSLVGRFGAFHAFAQGYPSAFEATHLSPMLKTTRTVREHATSRRGRRRAYLAQPKS